MFNIVYVVRDHLEVDTSYLPSGLFYLSSQLKSSRHKCNNEMICLQHCLKLRKDCIIQTRHEKIIIEKQQILKFLVSHI